MESVQLWCEVNKCCFCIELRTGCLIIGYMNLFGNTLLMIMAIIGLAAASVVMVIGKDQDERNLGAAMFISFTIMLIVILLFLAFTILLLVGLYQYKRNFVKAYLIYALIFIVVSILMFFISFINFDVGNVIRDLLSILLQIYFLVVIRSYYILMGRSDEGSYNDTAA